MFWGEKGGFSSPNHNDVFCSSFPGGNTTTGAIRDNKVRTTLPKVAVIHLVLDSPVWQVPSESRLFSGEKRKKITVNSEMILSRSVQIIQHFLLSPGLWRGVGYQGSFCNERNFNKKTTSASREYPCPENSKILKSCHTAAQWGRTWMEAMGEENDCVCCLTWEEGGGKWSACTCGCACTRVGGTGRKRWAVEARDLTVRKLRLQPCHNPAWELEETTSILSVLSPAELAVSLCKVKAAGSASSGFCGNPR